jgi:hypothetical protein
MKRNTGMTRHQSRSPAPSGRTRPAAVELVAFSLPVPVAGTLRRCEGTPLTMHDIGQTAAATTH